MLRRSFDLIAVVGGFGLLFAGCNGRLTGGLPGGGTNGDVVAPFLPDDVSLDVSELPDPDASTTAKSVRTASAITGVTAYDRTVRAAGAVLHAFQRTARRTFALGAAIKKDFTDANQTQVSGTFRVATLTVSYRADFAPFDIDGDGTADGSGKATVDPVALRMWVDRGNGFERFLCALVTTRPSSANVGAGQMFFKPSAAIATDFSDLQVRVNWDRTDTSHKWNEAFVSGRLRNDYVMSAGHQRVDVRTTTDGSVEKTVRSNASFTQSPFGFDAYSFSAHTLVGSGAILISGLSTGGTAQVDFTNVCVSVTDRSLATNGECDAFDTQDMAFIDAPTGSETGFPADFPAQPTFTPPTSGNDNSADNSNDNSADNSNSSGNDNSDAGGS